VCMCVCVYVCVSTQWGGVGGIRREGGCYTNHGACTRVFVHVELGQDPLIMACVCGSVCLVCMCACVQAQYEMVFAEFKDAGIANALPPNAPAFSAPVAD